jgi:hypothetical protein
MAEDKLLEGATKPMAGYAKTLWECGRNNSPLHEDVREGEILQCTPVGNFDFPTLALDVGRGGRFPSHEAASIADEERYLSASVALGLNGDRKPSSVFPLPSVAC